MTCARQAYRLLMQRPCSTNTAQPGAGGTTAGARPAASAPAPDPPPDLATEVRELVTLLEQTATETKSKDPWDKFAAVSTFVSSVIIALIGLYFTHSYNQAESARRTLQEARQRLRGQGHACDKPAAVAVRIGLRRRNNAASRLQIPAPRAEMNRKRKQKSTASSPSF